MMLLSSHSGPIGCIRVYSMIQPRIERTQPKTPAFSDFEGGHLAVPRFGLKSLPVHTKNQCGFLEVEERLESRTGYLWGGFGVCSG
jgi:hypothetical protein